MSNAGVAEVLPEPQEIFRRREIQVPGSVKSRKRPIFIKAKWVWSQKDPLIRLCPSADRWNGRLTSRPMVELSSNFTPNQPDTY